MAEGIPNPKDVVRTSATPPISGGETKRPPEEATTSFSSYMKGGTQANPLMPSGKTPQVSPFDLAHGKVAAAGPTINSIQEQTKVVNSTLGDITNQLNTPKLKLKQSSKYLLKNKLTSAQGHILSASAKAGAPRVQDEEEPSSGGGPLQKFLNLVTSGQNQLQATQQHLADVAAKGEEMNPADMLMVQIKLNKAQQQLEYSSLLLGKAVDDLKLMMNIQL